MAKLGPGYSKYPEHSVVLTPFRGRVIVEANGQVLVDTQNALQLKEADYPAVYYVPRQDAHMEHLQRTEHHTHCPFKGDSSYFSIPRRNRKRRLELRAPLRRGACDCGPPGVLSQSRRLDQSRAELMAAKKAASRPQVSLDHVSLPVKRLVAARKFYQAALGAIGMSINMDVGSAFGMGSKNEKIFWISQQRGASGGAHHAFRVGTRAAVHAFHQAGMSAGGKDHGAPGPRPNYGPHYYAAFLKDPEGNNIEVVCYRKAASPRRSR